MSWRPVPQCCRAQLALLVWSLGALQHQPGPGFWEQVWAASLPLLPKAFTLRDVVMLLEGALQLQQRAQPPGLKSALRTAVRSVPHHQQQQQQQRRLSCGSSSAGWGVQQGDLAPAAADSSSEQEQLPDLVRVAAAAARLQARPGHGLVLQVAGCVGAVSGSIRWCCRCNCWRRHLESTGKHTPAAAVRSHCCQYQHAGSCRLAAVVAGGGGAQQSRASFAWGEQQTGRLCSAAVAAGCQAGCCCCC